MSAPIRDFPAMHLGTHTSPFPLDGISPLLSQQLEGSNPNFPDQDSVNASAQEQHEPDSEFDNALYCYKAVRNGENSDGFGSGQDPYMDTMASWELDEGHFDAVSDWSTPNLVEQAGNVSAEAVELLATEARACDANQQTIEPPSMGTHNAEHSQGQAESSGDDYNPPRVAQFDGGANEDGSNQPGAKLPSNSDSIQGQHKPSAAPRAARKKETKGNQGNQGNQGKKGREEQEKQEKQEKPINVPNVKDLLKPEENNVDVSTRFSSYEEAQRMLNPPQEGIDTDLSLTEIQKKALVCAFFKAMINIEHAEDNKKTVAAWATLAKEQPMLIEAGCWGLLEAIIAYHRNGPLLPTADEEEVVGGVVGDKKKKKRKQQAKMTIKNGLKLSFNDRLHSMVDILYRRKTICKRMIDENYTYLFAMVPIHCLHRVRCNQSINNQKGKYINVGREVTKEREKEMEEEEEDEEMEEEDHETPRAAAATDQAGHTRQLPSPQSVGAAPVIAATNSEDASAGEIQLQDPRFPNILHPNPAHSWHHEATVQPPRTFTPTSMNYEATEPNMNLNNTSYADMTTDGCVSDIGLFGGYDPFSGMQNNQNVGDFSGMYNSEPMQNGLGNFSNMHNSQTMGHFSNTHGIQRMDNPMGMQNFGHLQNTAVAQGRHMNATPKFSSPSNHSPMSNFANPSLAGMNPVASKPLATQPPMPRTRGRKRTSTQSVLGDAEACPPAAKRRR